MTVAIRGCWSHERRKRRRIGPHNTETRLSNRRLSFPRIPQFDPPGCCRLVDGFRRGGTIDLGDKGRFVPFKKSFDSGQRHHEGVGEVRERRVAHDDQQRNAMVDHRLSFVWGIADTTVMGQRDPAPPADLFKPFFVGRIVDKMIGMPFNLQPGVPQDIRESISEIAIREIDKTQAARS